MQAMSQLVPLKYGEVFRTPDRCVEIPVTLLNFPNGEIGEQAVT